MKLQLSESASRAMALEAGTHTNIGANIASILAVFQAHGHNPFTAKDVKAVLSAMGCPDHVIGPWYPDPKWGMVKTGQWGFYTWSGTGGVVPVRVSAPAPVTRESLDGLVEIVTKPGISWVPSVPEASVIEGFYANDAGLRRLAVSESRCFGIGYAPDQDACQVCPLARFCAPTSLSRLAEIANQLDSETQKSLADAQTQALEMKRASEAPVEAPAPVAEAPAPVTEAPAPPSLPAGWAVLDLPFPGVCGKCDQTIPKGDRAYHIPGLGMHHPGCAENLRTAS